MNWSDLPVFPGSGEDPFARDVLPVHYRTFNAGLVITLLDVWVLDPAALRGMNVAHWLPVDTDRLGQPDRGFLAQSPGRPVAMSRHGEKALKDAGFPALYAPHALDTQAWSPLENRETARAQSGWGGKFMVGINAANQDPERKGFAEQLAAFARFAKRHDDAMLVIHSRSATQHGPDLEELIVREGLANRALLCDQAAYCSGQITDGQMISWHGMIDVLSNCSYGEGFGLAVLQSQACGVPVIVNDCSSMTELCGAGWKVAGQPHNHRNHRAYWRVPFISSIEAAYEKAYARRDDAALRARARKFALRYDHEAVYERYWKPVLAELIRPPAPVTLKAQRKIWAPVMYRGEADMLRMRLAETEGLVHRHVLAEAERTHRMVPRELSWPSAGKALARWAPSVTHVVAELPGDENPWVNEHAQRDAAWPVINAEAADSDWVLISDVDEIPSPSLLARMRDGVMPGEVASVRMKVYIHHLGHRVPDEKVPPQCVAATAGYIRRHGGSLAAIRDARDSYPVIGDGGWHFSWFGGPEAAAEKLATATCHTELLGNGEGDLIADGTRYYTSEDGGGLPVIPADPDDPSLPAWIRDRKCPAVWLGPAEVAVPA